MLLQDLKFDAKLYKFTNKAQEIKTSKDQSGIGRNYTLKISSYLTFFYI